MESRIFVIGAGGVGSWLLPSLCLLEHKSRLIIVDGDKLEEKNLNRQLFHKESVGELKATALGALYGCLSWGGWYASGSMDLQPEDWLIVCVDNHRARFEALLDCDTVGCKAIFAANETHSAEAFVYFPAWKGTPLDPRVYYPEIATDTSGDPRAAAIGCTGEAQKANRQLVSANFCAAALAQNLYVLWGMEVPKMEGVDEIIDRLPYKLVSSISKLETHPIGDRLKSSETK